ncbi:MAG: WG repeat-containing protein [Saprospiraceae bacterium]|nr:WG repeat-containing protein [Saprospiraceae bacterium]
MKNTLSCLTAMMMLLSSLAYSQINWTALEPGMNGVRYEVKYMTKTFVKVDNKVVQDSIPNTIKSEMDFRVVDALGNEKIGEIVYNKVDIPGFGGEDNRFFKEFLEIPTYVKLNNSYFNTKIFEKAVGEGTIFEQFYLVMTAPLESILNIGLPANGFEADAKWQLTRYDTAQFKGETAISISEYKYQLMGFKDTLGHQCAIVNYHTSSNKLPISPEMLALAEEIKMMSEYTSDTKGRILVDKTTGLPIAHKIWRRQKMDALMNKEVMKMNALEEIEMVLKENNLVGRRTEMAAKLSEIYHHNMTKLPAGTINEKLANNPKIRLIAPVQWSEIYENEAGTRFWLEGLGKSTLVDKDGNTILNPDNYGLSAWDKNDFFEDGYGVVRVKGRYEIIARDGSHIPIDKKYESVKPFYKGRAVAKLEDKFGGLRGLIDSTGKDVIEPMYSSIEEFSQGLAKVNRDSKQGIIDFNGKVIEPLNANIFITSQRPYGFTIIDKQTKKQTLISPYAGGKRLEGLDNYPKFSEGVAVVSKEKKYGIVDSTCAIIVPFEFDYISDYKNGGLIASKNKQYGVFDKTGKLVVPLEFERISNTPEPNLFYVSKTGKMGLMANDGSTNIPLEYTSIEQASNGVWEVSKDNKYGLLNSKGEVLLPIEYDRIDCVNKALGWVRATKNSKNYFITNGYSDITELSEQDFFLPCDMESDVAVRVDSLDRYGLYDMKGNVILPNEYDHIASLNAHAFVVKKGKTTGIVDNKGRFVQPLQAMEITNAKFVDKFFIYELSGRQGILDSQGNTIVEPLFDEIIITDSGAIQVSLDGRFGIIKLKDL